MNKIFIIIFCIITFIGCTRSISVGIKSYAVTNSMGDSLSFYLGLKEGSNGSDKLLVMVQGSGRESIQRRFGWGVEAANLGYDILYMEKYDFNDSVKFSMTDCRQRRMEDINFILSYVADSLYHGNLNEIMLFADSEGGVLAPELAVKNKTIKRMIIMGKGGLSGVEKSHLILDKELKNNIKGYFRMSGIETREQLDNLLTDIKNNPTTEKHFLGYTYKYWNSYIYYDIDAWYDKLTIPAIVLVGENDLSIPVESVTSLQDRYKNRKNLSFHVIPNVDHSFIDSEGNKKFSEVLKNVIYPWYNSTEIKQ